MEEKKNKDHSKAINDEELKDVSGGMASRYDIMDKQRPSRMSDHLADIERLKAECENL